MIEARLTEHEYDILLCAAHGLTNKEIGERFGIATQTVKNLLGEAYSALGANTRIEAFHAMGWMTLPEMALPGEVA